MNMRRRGPALPCSTACLPACLPVCGDKGQGTREQTGGREIFIQKRRWRETGDQERGGSSHFEQPQQRNSLGKRRKLQVSAAASCSGHAGHHLFFLSSEPLA